MRLHILTEKQLLRFGYDQMVKGAHDAYWQGRIDERHKIDSPYFTEPTKSELNRTSIPRAFKEAFNED